MVTETQAKETTEQKADNSVPLTKLEIKAPAGNVRVGEELPFNAVLVSEWTKQLLSVAFLLTEDDGGKKTSWKASATVKYNSKSYGIDVDIPLNSRDDIVWRGTLTSDYIKKYSGQKVRFGDVELVLELI